MMMGYGRVQGPWDARAWGHESGSGRGPLRRGLGWGRSLGCKRLGGGMEGVWVCEGTAQQEPGMVPGRLGGDRSLGWYKSLGQCKSLGWCKSLG